MSPADRLHGAADHFLLVQTGNGLAGSFFIFGSNNIQYVFFLQGVQNKSFKEPSGYQYAGTRIFLCQPSELFDALNETI